MNHHLIKLALVLSVALFGGFNAYAQGNAQTATIEAILVEASNAGSGIDRSLEPYAGTLQRLFKFDSYRRVGRSTFRVGLPGSGGGSIGNDSKLSIDARTAPGNALQADLDWTRNGRTLLHTRLKIRKGTPAVLGGPRSASGDGNYLLIILWK